jgi:hypothetical protein
VTADNKRAVDAAAEIERPRDRAEQPPKGTRWRTGPRSATGARWYKLPEQADD